MIDLITRSSHFAGTFYPENKNELSKSLEYYFKESSFGPQKIKKIKSKIFGLIVPHGAYNFSGAISANAFFEITSQIIDSVILIGPDHNGIGKRISIMSKGCWKTPLGDVLVDNGITSDLKQFGNLIEEDKLVHQYEHSLEIQIPFIQYSHNNCFTIVPLLIRNQDLETALFLGSSIAKTISNKNAVIIASSNFTHYEPNLIAHNKDLTLIRSIEKLDIELLYQTIMNLNISLCGFGPIASLMKAVKLLGSKKGILLKYATSGEVSSDNKNPVVGYASIAFV